MDTGHGGLCDEPRPVMAADEFEASYAAMSGLTVEALRALGRRVVRCRCDEAVCRGWASVSDEPRSGA